MNLSGCSKKKLKIPPDVLNHDQMVGILIDVHILEAKVKKLYLKNDSSIKVYLHYEDMLFDEHETTREQYKKSLEFYMQEVEVYKDIYDEVSDSLLARQKTKDFN